MGLTEPLTEMSFRSRKIVLGIKSDSLNPDVGGNAFLGISFLTRATQRHIPEDSILHSYCRDNFIS
jgi:hypothetical protein